MPGLFPWNKFQLSATRQFVRWSVKQVLLLLVCALLLAGLISLYRVSLRYDNTETERWWTYYFMEQFATWGQWVLWIPLLSLAVKQILLLNKGAVQSLIYIGASIFLLSMIASTLEGLAWHTYYNQSSEWPWPRVWKAFLSTRAGFHFLLGTITVSLLFIHQFVILSKSFKSASLVRNPSANINGSLVIKHQGRTEFIPFDQISHLNASGSYVEIYSTRGKSVVTGTLKEFARQLPQNQFIRIHRSFIVHVDKIQDLVPLRNEDYKVITTSGHELRLSRSYKSVLPALRGTGSSTD